MANETPTWKIQFKVEVKPYVLDDQLCDECQGSRCGGKFAPFFCANVTCLQVLISPLRIFHHLMIFVLKSQANAWNANCILMMYSTQFNWCFQYYCEQCWATIHSRPGREYHKPLVKEGADRPRALPFRWCWPLLMTSCLKPCININPSHELDLFSQLTLHHHSPLGS